MAAPPARVMVDTPAGKKSVAATSSAARSAAPAQKTYNYHKPAEEPFRAPPVQKTYNYHKPATSGYTQRAPGAMAAQAQRTLNVPPKAESFEDFMKRTSDEDKKYRDILFEKDKPASDYVDMPWSEYLPRVARNVLPSGAEMAYDVGNAAINTVRHPIDTGKAVLGGLGALAMGLGSKFDDTVRSAVGLDVDPVESERKQQMLNSVIEAAKGRYGFGEPGEFWKNLADNPASYIMDALALETGGASAAKKVANIADEAQKEQFLRFIAENRPKTDISQMAGLQYYRPSTWERSMMQGNPTPAEIDYMDRVKDAQFLRSMGVTEQGIQGQTGIMTLPVKDAVGQSLGDLDVAAMTPKEMINIRPSRANDYGATIFEDPATDNYGWFNVDPVTGKYEIGLNPRMSAEEKARTKEHEMTHADLHRSGVGWNILGSNAEDALISKNAWVKTLKEQERKANDPLDKAHLRDARKKLEGLTSTELYSWNPGEMLARLSEGNPYMSRRLTALQTLNKYLNPDKLAVTRGLESLLTATHSETYPFISRLKAALRSLEDDVELGKYPNYGYGTEGYPLDVSVDPSFDVYRDVPTDIDKAISAGYSDTTIPTKVASSKAVVRRDNEFRGHGDMPISYINQGQTPADFAGQYAIRTTKADQIDDLIESGLVRQKVGGYGKPQKSTIYFGTQSTPDVKIGNFPGQLHEGNYAIVAKADKAAEYNNKGGLPLDALQHIWALRDGKIVDILPEVLRKNQSTRK